MGIEWAGLKEKWTKHNVYFNMPATLEEIENFEKKHGILVPLDFKSYLLHVNGAKDEAWDDDLMCFWSLKDIKSLEEDDMCSGSKGVSNANEYFIFADHSIRIYDFAVRCTENLSETTPVYYVFGPPRQITDSFSEFIERYVAGDEQLIYPNP